MALWDIATRILTQTADTIAGLVIRRHSSVLNANLQEWQDETGAVLSYVGNQGSLSIKGGIGRDSSQFSYAEDTISAGGSTTPYQMWNPGAGQYHFKSYVDRLDLAAIRPGALNPYNSLTPLKVSGLSTTVGKPTANTWVAADTFIDAKGVVQLCTAGGTPGVWASGGWQLAGFYKFASALATSGAITIPAFDELMIVCRIVSTSATDIPALRFNGDTGANYWSRYLTAVAGGVTLVNTANINDTMAKIVPLTGTAQRHIVCYVSNKLAATKLATVHSQGATAAAGTTGTLDVAGAFEWVNTAAQITSVTMLTSGGTNTMAIDSGFLVFGRDLA